MNPEEAISREVAFFVLSRRVPCLLVASALACSTPVGSVGTQAGPPCKAANCGSYVKASVSTTLDDIAGARVVACRNDECVDGTVERVNDSGSGLTFVCRFPSHAAGCQGASIATFEFEYVVPPTGVADGDRYTFRVLASDGSVKGEKTGAATYTIVQPNGPACAPTCHQAAI